MVPSLFLAPFGDGEVSGFPPFLKSAATGGGNFAALRQPWHNCFGTLA